MVGENVCKHPNEYKKVIERGHRIGNHTYNHLQGLKERTEKYVANTDKADLFLSTDLFRPPHGFMRRKQYSRLIKRYRIIMWDLVTRDYDSRLTGEQVLNKVKKYVRPGSIITFHDSLRSINNLHYALPRTIEWLLTEGYEFKTL